MIADAYLKGIGGFDGERAFQACVKSATYRKQNGVPYVLDQEYIPCDKVGEATSIAMEYAVDDWGDCGYGEKREKRPRPSCSNGEAGTTGIISIPKSVLSVPGMPMALG